MDEYFGLHPLLKFEYFVFSSVYYGSLFSGVHPNDPFCLRNSVCRYLYIH